MFLTLLRSAAREMTENFAPVEGVKTDLPVQLKYLLATVSVVLVPIVPPAMSPSLLVPLSPVELQI